MATSMVTMAPTHLVFPVELFAMIIEYTVSLRSLARAVRLGFVCNMFYQEVSRALFRDPRLNPRAPQYVRLLQPWWRAGESFWIAYLVHMVQKDDRRRTAVLAEINTVADFLARSGVFLDFLEGMCRLSLPRVFMLWATDWWGRSFRTVNETRTEQLLAAAAHFGHIDLVKTLLREGIDPSKQSKLFDLPIKVAAEYERNDIVELMLSSSSDENQLLSGRGSAIKGASKGGHIVTLDLILESRWGPGTKHRRIIKTLIWSLRVVRRIEIFIHIEKLINSSGILIPSINFKHLLILAARNGDLEIARHILSRPGFKFGLLLKHKCLKVALREAARRGHSEIVELLFRRTRYFMTRDEKLLSFAAKGGHLRVVEKLITLGFDVNPDKVHLNADLTPPIFCAIALEHEPMFHLLRKQGAVLNTIHTGGDALICFYTEGLESVMALLLRGGVDINSEPLSRIPDFNEQEFQEMLAEV